MSFAVFGATMALCRKLASKRVSPMSFQNGIPTPKSQSELAREIEAKAKSLFERYQQGRTALPKLSADMSQPKACKEFIDLCKGTETTMLIIMQKQPLLDTNGQPKLNKKKQPIMRYQAY